ncbi:MAG: hypothetical protein KDC95_23870 [Planctomycetes bacterium]|nr:hypothetical protein [Planctomycetota bacterium]
MNVRLAGIVLAGSVVLSVAACTASSDVGSTPEAQLCDVLSAVFDEGGDTTSFALEPLIEGGATDPTDVPPDVLAIGLTFRTKADAYDRLGPYEPALRFAAALTELSQDGLVGPSTLTPQVLRSAQAIDRSLVDGACESS